jgi:dipeptidyl aminopeptidase/acylaminoacyl peptidase
MVKWDGGEPQQLVDKSDVRMPRWSPDGERIAFFSDRDGETRIWLLSVESGQMQPVPMTGDGHGQISTHVHYSGLEWSPDGRKLAFTAQDSVEPEDKLVWKDWYRTEGFGDIRHRVQIWTIDADGGAPFQLTHGDYHSAQPAWSPDGTRIAFMSNRSGREESILYSVNENYDVWLVAATGGAPRKMTTNEGPDTRPVWSPDGQFLAYVSVPYRGSHWDVTRLSLVDVDSGEVTALTDLSSFDFGVNLEPGAWVGSDIFFTAMVGAATHAFRIEANVADSQPEAIVAGDRNASSLSISRDGKRLVFLSQNPSHPADVWTSRSDGKRLRQLTDTNPQLNGLASAELVRWASSDGMQIEGIVVKPEGFDPTRRYPLVVRPHGGPHGNAAWRFHTDDQFYASQGYVVFAPNFRGSTGYGQAFVDADRGQLGGGDFLDLMSGVDYLIGQEYVDPDRLVIAGISYGGFMTTWAVGHTDRFKAAMAGAPVVNAQSMFATSDIPAWVTWEYLGPPWKNPDLIRTYSPITYVQNVTTPTLIIHGEDDVRVPLSQGREFWHSLRTLGVPTEFVIYPGEQHGSWSPEHQVDILERTVDWFARYLE